MFAHDIRPRARSLLLTLLLAASAGAPAQTEPTAPSTPAPAAAAPAALPSFAELEAGGATIGEIRVSARDIFDLDDPREDKLLFRWANKLHINTRPDVIERALLFASGERVSVRLIEETERVLRATRYLHDVQIRPLAVHVERNVVDIEVITRDSWTLDPSISASRSGGASSSSIGLKEYNLLGTGIAFGYQRKNTVDRSINEFEVSNDRAFGGWTSLLFSRSNNSDGKRHVASIAQPFYALDARWAAGVSFTDDDRIESIYRAGVIDSQFRHRERSGELYGGLSTGRRDGWVRRITFGVTYQHDTYALEPDRVAPPQLPADEKLITPFVRVQWVEDDFRTLLNRNLIGRPETFALGLNTTLMIGRASTGLGSTLDAWLYSGSVSRGFEFADGQTLVASGNVSGQYALGSIRRQIASARVQYYRPQGSHWLFYASAAGDRLTHPGPTNELVLGGDNGLRGYPMRYQSGHRRAIFTLEERAYSDVYLWRLFRLGGAVFADLGRAWGGDTANTLKPGWLSDVGLGLRIYSVRSGFSNVIHVDVAFPNDPDVNVKKMQFSVKTKASF